MTPTFRATVLTLANFLLGRSQGPAVLLAALTCVITVGEIMK
jgi:hypothetical protein